MGKTINEETLQTIEDCGAAEMPIAETLEIAEMSETDWNATPEAAKRYRKGQLKTKMSIRNAIVKGAKSGNPALLKAYQEFAAESEDAGILRRVTDEANAQTAEFANI